MAQGPPCCRGPAYLGLALHQHDVGDDRSLQAPRRLRELSCAERPRWPRCALQRGPGWGQDGPSRAWAAHACLEGGQLRGSQLSSPGGPRPKAWRVISAAWVGAWWPEQPTVLSPLALRTSRQRLLKLVNQTVPGQQAPKFQGGARYQLPRVLPAASEVRLQGAPLVPGKPEMHIPGEAGRRLCPPSEEPGEPLTGPLHRRKPLQGGA